MNIISIDGQQGMLGLNITAPRLRLHSTMPAVELSTRQPQLKMHSEDAVLHIDQTKCFEDVSLRKIVSFNNYNWANARQKTMEAIAEISREGDLLGAIENGLTIPALAVQEWDQDHTEEFVLRQVPSHRPEISIEPRETQLSYTPGDVSLRLRRGQFQNNFEYGTVKGYYLRQQYLNISFVPYHYNIIS
jgi:hypothetical protein